MTNTTRGRLMALFAVAAFAGAVQLVFHPFRKPPPPPPPVDPAVAEAEKQAICTPLQREYEAAWQSTTSACTEDEQCVVEQRTPTWSGADECWRIGNKEIAHGVADGAAKVWRNRGCSNAQALAKPCPPPPAVHCRRSHCVERPTPSLPADWKRHIVPKVARLYLPPDFQPVTPDVKTSAQLPIYAELEGKGRTLAISVVWRAVPSRSAAPVAVGAPGAKVFAQPSITLDDYIAPFTIIEGRPTVPFLQGKTAAKPRRFNAFTELADVSGTGIGVAGNLEGPGKMWLVVGMTCDAPELCEPLAQVAEHSELLLFANSPKKADAGAPSPSNPAGSHVPK